MGDPRRAGHAAFGGAPGTDGESGLKLPVAPLGMGDLLGQPHGGPEVGVLAHDDGGVVALLVGRLDEIESQAHVHPLLLAGRVDPAGVDVDTLVAEVAALVGPEAVPEPVDGGGRDSGIEADLVEVALREPSCEARGERLDVVAGPRVRR